MMGLTNRQKQLLHVVPAALGIDKTARLMIQRTVGGFESAADAAATHEGFAAVMAHYEGRNGGSLPRYTPGYWKASHERNEREGGDPQRLRHVIVERAADMGWSRSDVEAFLVGPHVSGGKVASLATASAYWLDRCLTAITAIAARKANAEFLDALETVNRLSEEPPTPGEIVAGVRAWMSDDHPYVDLLDFPFSDKTMAFLDDCADRIAQRGEGARFSDRQVSYLRDIWREAVHEIKLNARHVAKQLEREGVA